MCTYIYIYMGVSGPYNIDYSILGSMLGYPDSGKLPYRHSRFRGKGPELG